MGTPRSPGSSSLSHKVAQKFKHQDPFATFHRAVLTGCETCNHYTSISQISACPSTYLSLAKTMMTTMNHHFSTDHIAIVVLLDKADNASIRTVLECTKNFNDEQVFVVGFGDSVSAKIIAAVLDKYDLDLVKYSFQETNDKYKVLGACCANLPPEFSHVLLVDTQVGSRVDLLQDGLARTTDIPTCALFTGGTPCRRRRKQRLPRGAWLSSSSRSLGSGNHHRNRQFSCPPTFDKHGDGTKPNHFLDLWERQTLESHLRRCRRRRHSSPATKPHPQQHYNSVFCSLRQALIQASATESRFFSSGFSLSTSRIVMPHEN